MASQYFGISAAARMLAKSEQTVRDIEARGVVVAMRDSAGRRLFTAEQIETMRSYLAGRRGRTAA